MKPSKSELKKQIRDTQRLITKMGHSFTAEQASESQRKLNYLNLELLNTESEAIQLKMYQKYKYVKFIEQKKCLKRVKQLEKLCKEESKAEDDDEENVYSGLTHDELIVELLKQKENLRYIMHYPKDYKYISVFTEDEVSLKEVEKIKNFVNEMCLGKKIRIVLKKDIFGEGTLLKKEVVDEKDDFFE